MKKTFLEALQAQTEAFGTLSTTCRMSICPGFADLDWPEDPFDPMASYQDPGIEFQCGKRRLVLVRIQNQLRYYAGTVDFDDPAFELTYEIGVFRCEAKALAFGIDYLVNQLAFSEIQINREIRLSSVA